ncbi:hypothetical protein BGZ61DRAFT_68585 [Ilyonectria robusta]|uniref:uncharacterized protein n=1 Tax=Ilyonectria robusta TaxID=1079257 RepID=UPI001E8D5798|nr:uncharacterized protein BGZ61DRAFT_68585 [Ilyonectria robusta]KAH8679167.1 hypothetical protein BGZ61DRAFT_68585 [Ilyonectria robusta]
MYIPSAQHHIRVSVAQERLGTGALADSHGSRSHFVSVLCRLGLSPLRLCAETGSGDQATIRKRQFSDNPDKNTNIKIGLIVGILVAAFLAVVITFLYFYGRSIRFTEKKKKHHRHKSSSSKSSRSSDRGAPPSPRPRHPRPPRSAPPRSPPPPRSATPADDAPPPKEPPADG